MFVKAGGGAKSLSGHVRYERTYLGGLPLLINLYCRMLCAELQEMPRYTSTVDSSTGLVEGQAGVTVLLINEMHLIFGTYVDFLYYFFPLKNRLIAFLYSLLQLISKLKNNSPIPVID